MSCCINNCLNPQAPEYNKCRKPENNAGCSCSCASGSNAQEEVSSDTTIVLSSKYRNRVDGIFDGTFGE